MAEGGREWERGGEGCKGAFVVVDQEVSGRESVV